MKNELFDLRTSCAAEFHHQFARQVRPPVREVDSQEDRCIRLLGIVNSEGDLAGLGSAGQGEGDTFLRAVGFSDATIDAALSKAREAFRYDETQE